MAATEREDFEAAKQAAVEAVKEGDVPIVAADWAAENHDVEHRFDELLEHVREATDDE